MSRELSLHPIHLKPDINQNLPPSSLVPFCSYQGDYSLLGVKTLELQNLTFCDKFEPSILEGQLCYSLDVTKFERKMTKTGKKSGLLLLLDPNPYPRRSTGGNVEVVTIDHEPFKVYIHTLAEHTAFGPGAYGMYFLKRMTGTTNFYQLPDSQKDCHRCNVNQGLCREKCETEMFISQVMNNCNCVPWALTTENSNMKVSLHF